MEGRDTFESTHRIVALGDEEIPACKRALVAELRERAAELRVIVHSTERDRAPEAITDLDPIDPAAVAFADDENGETERRGPLPDGSHVVDAVLATMGDDGSLPVTSLCFRGPGFDAAVTASTSHSHVGRLDYDETVPDEDSTSVGHDDGPASADHGDGPASADHGDGPASADHGDGPASVGHDEPTPLDALSDAVSGIGVVVPDGPMVRWEQDGAYVELDAAECCVHAERPGDPGDCLSTTHVCHDLTRLVEMRADSDAGRIELAWRDADSLAGRAFEFAVGRPPTELRVPGEEFETVETYLERFVSDRGAPPNS